MERASDREERERERERLHHNWPHHQPINCEASSVTELLTP